MDYIIKKEEELKFIGFVKEIKNKDGNTKCPSFWDEINKNYFENENIKENIKKAIKDNSIGEYGICFNENDTSFEYMIGGIYKGGIIPEEMEVISFESLVWAKFKSIGKMPGAIQKVTGYIWNDWIIKNKEYKLALNADIEWYSSGDTSSSEYESEVWIPIKKKNL